MKRILTIAGSDSSGGAGIQADIKTIFALGAYPLSVITVLTAQHSLGIDRIEPVSLKMVAAQLDSVLNDIGVDAVKVGMLYSRDIVKYTASRLGEVKPAMVVVDPMLQAKVGHTLLADDAFQALKDEILPLADIITPNIPETEVLTGLHIENIDQMEKAAKELAGKYGVSVVIKGGHLQGEALDLLYHRKIAYHFSSPRYNQTDTHGTGCTFSSALAVFLAQGEPIPKAVTKAKLFVQYAIKGGLSFGKATGPVNQFAYLEQKVARFDVIQEIEEVAESLMQAGFNCSCLELGYALPWAAAAKDIASFAGVISTDGNEVRQRLRFGAGEFLSSVLLASTHTDSARRSACVIDTRSDLRPNADKKNYLVLEANWEESDNENKKKQIQRFRSQLEHQLGQVDSTAAIIGLRRKPADTRRYIFLGRTPTDILKMILDFDREAFF